MISIYLVRALGRTSENHILETEADSPQEALKKYLLHLWDGSPYFAKDGEIFESHGHEQLAHVHNLGTVLITRQLTTPHPVGLLLRKEQ
jgi:hypothetical protein